MSAEMNQSSEAVTAGDKNAEPTVVVVDKTKKSAPTTSCEKCLKTKLIELKIDPGLSKILEAESFALSSFWAFIYIAFWITIIVASAIICAAFYRYEVVTNTDFEKEDSLAFPTVVFCDNTVLGRLSDINKTLESQYFADYFAIKNDTNLSLSEKITHLYVLDINYRYVFLSELKTKSNSSNEIKKVLKSNVISCLYNSQPCEDFLVVEYDYGLGICYYFNGNGGGIEVTAARTGDHNGLLIHYVQPTTEKSVPSVYGNGIKMFIKDKTRNGLTYDGGITLRSGIKTSIAMEKTETKRMSAPYGKCIDPPVDEAAFPFYAKTSKLYNFYEQK